ncbi:hypothetical protein LJ737_14710 [Hymenobacter sp. 15J16-1T3B]|nr:hypothetical protein [Hymenobacter sp. 15J16-1T3B]
MKRNKKAPVLSRGPARLFGKVGEDEQLGDDGQLRVCFTRFAPLRFLLTRHMPPWADFGEPAAVRVKKGGVRGIVQ